MAKIAVYNPLPSYVLISIGGSDLRKGGSVDFTVGNLRAHGVRTVRVIGIPPRVNVHSVYRPIS